MRETRYKIAKYITSLILVMSLNVSAQNSTVISTPTFPTLHFKENKARITRSGKDSLDKVVLLAQKFPDRNLKVLAMNIHHREVLEWNRTNAAINYLVKRGISPDRLIFSYTWNEEPNDLWFEFTDERIDSNPPPPTNLRRRGGSK